VHGGCGIILGGGSHAER